MERGVDPEDAFRKLEDIAYRHGRATGKSNTVVRGHLQDGLDELKDNNKLDQDVELRSFASVRKVRQKNLSEFSRTQQKRIEDKLQDIVHVRNGRPAPSGVWHSRDGIPFNNREGLLPDSSTGYTEYRVLGAVLFAYIVDRLSQ